MHIRVRYVCVMGKLKSMAGESSEMAVTGMLLLFIDSLVKCILFWQSEQDIKNRVTASRGKKA